MSLVGPNPVNWATNNAPLSVANEADLAGLPVLQFATGTLCTVKNGPTSWIWIQGSGAGTVAGVSVAVTGGAWLSYQLGSLAGNINTVVGAAGTLSLQRTVPVSPTTVNVKGYTTAGDGGGGAFYWDAANVAADNGGTIIRPVGVLVGAWVRIFSGGLNVRWFGATGDGITDDTVAIRNTIAAVLALTLGGSIYFPGGTYLLTNFVTITNGGAQSLTIYGDGKNSIVKLNNELGFSGIGVFGLVIRDFRITGAWTEAIKLSGASKFRIANMFFDGGTLTPPTIQNLITPIMVDNSSDGIIEENDISNVTHTIATPTYAIATGVNAPNSRLAIRANRIISACAFGIVCIDCIDHKVQDNYIDMAGSPASAGGQGYGIQLYVSVFASPASANPNFRSVCSGNTVKNTPGNGIFLGGCWYTSVANNVLESNCLTLADPSLVNGSIAVQGTFEQNVTVTGNIVRLSTKSGIAVQGNAITVVGNTVESCTNSGISIEDTDIGVVVDGNTIRNCQRGIFGRTSTANVKSVRITNNNIRLCSAQGISLANAIDCIISGNFVQDTVNACIQLTTNGTLTGTRNVIVGNRVSQCSAESGYDIRSTDSIFENNHASACAQAGMLIQAGATNCIVQDNIMHSNGAPGSIVGTVDLTTLNYGTGGSLAGLTLIFTVDGGAAQTVTFVTPFNANQVAQQINYQSTGVVAKLSATNRLVMTSETGGTTSNVTITGGTGAATLGVTALAGSGLAPTGGDQFIIQPATSHHKNNRWSPAGAMFGTAVLAAGTTGAIANVEVRTGDQIVISKTGGTAANAGALQYSIVNATSFTITSSNAADDAAVNWEIRH